MQIFSLVWKKSAYLYFFNATVDPLRCNHEGKNNKHFRIVAIDTWDEFVDSSKNGIIVRAKDNWVARLAATSLSVQRRHKTIVMRIDDKNLLTLYQRQV